MFRFHCILFVVIIFISKSYMERVYFMDQWYDRMKVFCNKDKPYGFRIFDFISTVCYYRDIVNKTSRYRSSVEGRPWNYTTLDSCCRFQSTCKPRDYEYLCEPSP